MSPLKIQKCVLEAGPSLAGRALPSGQARACPLPEEPGNPDGRG